ncbi:MAG: hypothetical protein ABI166_00480, partial [Mucilaginibacter sp.]
IGNISKNIQRQGNNYFQMNLNAETAEYVYKIIAVKELFEFPELYMKNFGYNVFSNDAPKNKIADEVTDVTSFSSMTLNINEKDGNHPDNLDTTVALVDKNKIKDYATVKNSSFVRPKFVYARITGKYKNFNDGDLVSFELQTDFQVGNNFVRKGRIMQWQGWKIDDRVFIDLGYGHNVILYDLDSQHGISPTSLQKKSAVIIMINNDGEG